MIDYVYIGSSPGEERCAQVGNENYSNEARKECKAYINQLWRIIKDKKRITLDVAPAGFSIITQGQPHDFGRYYEVVIKITEDNKEVWDLAIWVENNSPSEWDNEAKKELGI